MEINSVKSIYNKMQVSTGSANTPGIKKPADEVEPATAESRGSDTVDISSEASFMSKMSKMARTYSPPVRQPASADRIAQLREQYKNGACPISGSDIAAKIIAGILGPNGKE